MRVTLNLTPAEFAEYQHPERMLGAFVEEFRDKVKRKLGKRYPEVRVSHIERSDTTSTLIVEGDPGGRISMALQILLDQCLTNYGV
jgi:hypothetical protein